MTAIVGASSISPPELRRALDLARVAGKVAEVLVHEFRGGLLGPISLEAGASDYITKPVDADQLMSLLRVWLYQA